MTTIPENTLLRFELTVENTNLILLALGRLPYEQVYKLVDDMQRQATVQLQNNINNGQNVTTNQ